MVKPLFVASIAGFLMLGVPALAHADRDGDDRGHGRSGDGDNDSDDRGARGHHSAPEPLTTLGLVLGAGGVAVARWAAKRKSRTP
jgi:hypothetical protein